MVDISFSIFCPMRLR